MSSVVRTVTPFINMETLLKALTAVGCHYTIQGNTILTDRHDYYGTQKFVLDGSRYVFMHDSSAADMKFGPNYPWGNIDMRQYKSVGSFLNAVAVQYSTIYNGQIRELESKRIAAAAQAEQLEKAEQERQRQLAQAEAERKRAEEEQRRIEQERLAAIARAERLRKEQLAEEERRRQLAQAEAERKRAEEEQRRIEQERLAAIARAERLRKEQLAEEDRLKLLAQAQAEIKKAEEEKQRLERERKEFVEKQRSAIVAKAKEQGYDVRETVVDSKIKLVLIQTTY
ncbi:MAG: hypothetical protein FWG66_15625 [Spirochaetes bacterium]|nr:hypothetical protein [Spirochaetota bacterium]